MKSLLGLFVAILWAAPVLAQDSPEETVAAFHAALEAGETAKALSFMTADVVVYEQGGAERSRAEYENQHLQADADFAKAVHSTRTVKGAHMADGMAWVISESRTTGRYAEADIDRVGMETMILRRVGSDWRIAHIHWSGRAAPKPTP